MMQVRPGVSCERVGDAWLVLAPGGVVHNVTGPAAEVLDCAMEGRRLPAGSGDAVAALVDAGIVADSGGMSRRRVLAVGGGAAAVGLTTMVLPMATAAASPAPNPSTSTTSSTVAPSELDAPTDVTAAVGTGVVDVSWTEVTGATSYQVFVKPTSEGESGWVPFGSPVADGPVAVSGLNVSVPYEFYVVALAGTTSSAPSATATATLINSGVGRTFVTRTVPQVGSWWSVTFGNGLFVAVGDNTLMTSPDGLTWTWTNLTGVGGLANWRSVTFGNGLFVAVAGSGNARVMTSPDGVTWTVQTAPNGGWFSVTHGMIDSSETSTPSGTLVPGFVAVSQEIGDGDRVMTSPDGITWTTRASATAADTIWRSVTYGNGLFVATSVGGTNRVMTSPDGITWTGRNVGTFSGQSVTFGAGTFVAVTPVGTDRVMTSTDGINWQTRTTPFLAPNAWHGVTYGNGLFLAVSTWASSFVAADLRFMTSPDGVTWTNRTCPAGTWRGVCFANNRFVAVSSDLASGQVMISS